MAEEISTYGSTVTIDEKVNNSAQYAAEITFKQVFNKVNRTRQEALANESGAEVTYPAGLVMGRVNATGKIQEFVATATDGSQYPIGIIGANYTIADSAEENVTLAIDCHIPEGNIKFAGSEDLYSTIVDGKLLIDRFNCDCNINVTNSVDSTTSDNYPT